MASGNVLSVNFGGHEVGALQGPDEAIDESSVDIEALYVQAESLKLQIVELKYLLEKTASPLIAQIADLERDFSSTMEKIVASDPNITLGIN